MSPTLLKHRRFGRGGRTVFVKLIDKSVFEYRVVVVYLQPYTAQKECQLS
jgi:hypothetical protein